MVFVSLQTFFYIITTDGHDSFERPKAFYGANVVEGQEDFNEILKFELYDCTAYLQNTSHYR